jgi:hypothetical protein
MDVKRAGILTDKKLLELGGHPDVVVLPPDQHGNANAMPTHSQTDTK